MHINTVLPETKTLKQIENILITQARPEGEKSPYFEMAKKYKVNLNFQPFIRVDPISAKDFRKQKIEIPCLFSGNIYQP